MQSLSNIPRKSPNVLQESLQNKEDDKDQGTMLDETRLLDD